jgi:hypothetical protein
MENVGLASVNSLILGGNSSPATNCRRRPAKEGYNSPTGTLSAVCIHVKLLRDIQSTAVIYQESHYSCLLLTEILAK